jgi:hypothetical protein
MNRDELKRRADGAAKDAIVDGFLASVLVLRCESVYTGPTPGGRTREEALAEEAHARATKRLDEYGVFRRAGRLRGVQDGVPGMDPAPERSGAYPDREIASYEP